MKRTGFSRYSSNSSSYGWILLCILPQLNFGVVLEALVHVQGQKVSKTEYKLIYNQHTVVNTEFSLQVKNKNVLL